MMLLDLVEVAKSHTGVNLGIEFVNVVKNFGIQDKVSVLKILQRKIDYLSGVHGLRVSADGIPENGSRPDW